MASVTATIRVTRETRDLLARQAAERGVSLSALLSDIARERELDAVWRSERAASRHDARSREATAEEREWETTLDDGLG
jgi:antitoxin MazE7